MSSTSNDPGPRSRQHQQIGQRTLYILFLVTEVFINNTDSYNTFVCVNIKVLLQTIRKQLYWYINDVVHAVNERYIAIRRNWFRIPRYAGIAVIRVTVCHRRTLCISAADPEFVLRPVFSFMST